MAPDANEEVFEDEERNAPKPSIRVAENPSKGRGARDFWNSIRTRSERL